MKLEDYEAKENLEAEGWIVTEVNGKFKIKNHIQEFTVKFGFLNDRSAWKVSDMASALNRIYSLHMGNALSSSPHVKIPAILDPK